MEQTVTRRVWAGIGLLAVVGVIVWILLQAMSVRTFAVLEHQRIEAPDGVYIELTVRNDGPAVDRVVVEVHYAVEGLGRLQTRTWHLPGMAADERRTSRVGPIVDADPKRPGYTLYVDTSPDPYAPM